jgi:uncharacterized protein
VASILTRLRVDQISEEATPYALRPDAAWIESLDLGAEARFDPPPIADLEMNRARDEVFVVGRIKGRMVLPCSRCLEPAQIPFDQHFRVVYLRAPEGPMGPRASGAREIEPGDPCEIADEEIDLEGEDIFQHVRGWLDLAPMLREQLVLAIPDRALCSEECRGLCPTCGTNLNLAPCQCHAQEGSSSFEKLRGLRIR